ncbi:MULTISPECIES: hypothetical protein [Actinomadura]|uniref:Cell wall-associated hydrolase, NlpC family n=1 Tax=Actinomadura madurae TaxID=1993 RepID=A0A1I5RES1_9ACTN|nr:hypothetical protein [Actinomadura madurae]SFP56870.1 Cell wall-associated hydrolase, NlpC family [Actinomadura madurae]SPT59308.1 Uncharacterised protein [Actinomadura madurae]
MTGKHCKYRGPLGLTPRAAGALVGLAVFGGVAATTAHAAVSPASGGDDKAAAVTANVVKDAPAAKKPAAKKAPAEKAAADSGGEKIDARSKVISRARSWQPHSDDRVPYSQVRTHEGYRADCSGFVSMALGLPKPGQNTVGLTSSKYTKRIKMSELKKGDLVMDAEGTNTTRHVVIFEKWANSKHTAYWAFEQRGRYGTDYRTRDYGLDSGSEYKAYRPTNL